jgi:hypothetical protein
MSKLKSEGTAKLDRAFAPLNLGDQVKIKHYGGKFGRIVELRGPLGPGGASVYRVMVQRKPTASYIELLGNQIEAAPALKAKLVVPAAKPRIAAKTGNAVKRRGTGSVSGKPE